jgi:hypothetical protein
MPLTNIPPGHFINVKLDGLLEAKPAPKTPELCQCSGCGRTIVPRCDTCRAPLKPHKPMMCEDAAARNESGHPGWTDALTGVAHIDRSRVDVYASKGRHVHTSCVRGLTDWLTSKRTELV